MLKTSDESSDADESASTDALTMLRFEVPGLPNQYVERPRLISKLDMGADRPLVLVSAPAGSGKTTLLAAWVSKRADDQVGWLTFDEVDEAREVFWPLVAETMRRCGLELPTPSTYEANAVTHSLVAQLGDALAQLSRPLTLVLDCLEITDPALAGDIDFLLTHSGRGLRLIILTRADPVLPLHRYRLNETLTELRMSDLSFSAAETAELITAFGVELSDDSLTTLIRRARGWAVGLRFAAMLLAASSDPSKAVEQLAGDYGNIAEYLLVESLETLSAEERDLLLRTSIVDVVQPGLLEELGGRLAGRTLARLAHGNVLVEELVGHPGCFRYHPFLRDLLRAELSFSSPRRLKRLRRRAARWCAAHDQLQAAVELATGSGAWTEAAGYVLEGLAVGRLAVPGQADSLDAAFEAMPLETPGAAATVVRAALALARGRLDLCDAELTTARAGVEDEELSEVSVVRLSIDVVDAVRARCADEAGAVEATVRAVDRLALRTKEGARTHADMSLLLESNLGMALFRAGQFTAAVETLAPALRTAEASEAGRWSVTLESQLALVESVRGRLAQAHRSGVRAIGALELTSMASQESTPAEADLALGWVSIEQGDVVAASEQLRRATRKKPTDPVTRAVLSLLQARLARAAGDADGALDRISIARQRPPSRAPWVKDLFVIEAAEVLIARGEAAEARRLLDELHDSDPAAAALVLGHAQLLLGEWDAVARAVARLSRDRDGSAPPSTMVGGLLLESALELHRGHHQRARAALGRSLRLAGPDCLRRPFHQAPAVVRRLLAGDSQLLSQSLWLEPAAADGRTPRHRVFPTSDPTVTLASGDLIEPLTAKELEVLGLLSELMSTQEIASCMFISVNTVRTHVRSILRKLAVSRRNEAVRRARALGLLGSTDQQLISSG